jgi:CRISPR/Cas system CSM-associated protein Csm3 (group 7 of RAMP superfamily)
VNQRPPFNNRCRITGKLILTSDLYVGDGGARSGEGPREEKAAAEIATVARGVEVMADGREREFPVIPGAALKGVLRSYLKQCGVEADRIERLFGRAPASKTVNGQDLKDEELGAGGRVDFRYARLMAPDRPVGTAAFVGVNRATRGPADRILFAADYVPRGSEFAVELFGYDLSDQDLATLVQALEGFEDEACPIRLGANHADFCGRAKWELAGVQKMGRTELAAWLAAPTPRSWRDSSQVNAASATAHPAVRLLHRRPRLSLKVELHFQAPLLVNDPAHCRRPDEEHGPDRITRLTRDRHVLLPASSVRGAVRAQAERIARTLDPLAGGNPFLGQGGGGLIEKLFGHSKKRSLVEVSDFLSEKTIVKQDLFTQEFVAVDRFTGGAAEKLKFNARGYYPVGGGKLSGTLAVDLGDLDSAGLGLLALTFRDLVEGDVAFGSGASKGYGACRGRVTEVHLTGEPPHNGCGPLWRMVSSVDWSNITRWVEAPGEVKAAVGKAVGDLHKAIAQGDLQ